MHQHAIELASATIDVAKNAHRTAVQILEHHEAVVEALTALATLCLEGRPLSEQELSGVRETLAEARSVTAAIPELRRLLAIQAAGLETTATRVASLRKGARS